MTNKSLAARLDVLSVALLWRRREVLRRRRTNGRPLSTAQTLGVNPISFTSIWMINESP